MSNKPTDKEMKVMDAILNGEQQNIAYMAVYGSKNLNSAGAAVNRMLRKVKCVDYLAEKRKEIADKHIITREYKLQKLKEVIDKPDKQSDLISAIKVANDMDGHNAPDKLQIIEDEIKITAETKEQADRLNKALDKINNDN
jgi:hypothetical protein